MLYHELLNALPRPPPFSDTVRTLFTYVTDTAEKPYMDRSMRMRRSSL